MITFTELCNVEEAVLNIGDKSAGYPKFNQILILAGGGGCFAGDTLVKTSSGYKNISDVTTDDKVYSFNEETKEFEFKPVENVHCFENHPERMLKLTFENGETVICTESHEFYVDGEWVKAKDL